LGGKGRSAYSCEDPPCLHLVIDDRRRIYKVFLEDAEYITPVSLSALKRICGELGDPRLSRYREASGDEEEYLARKYLEAHPVDEKED